MLNTYTVVALFLVAYLVYRATNNKSVVEERSLAAKPYTKRTAPPGVAYVYEGEESHLVDDIYPLPRDGIIPEASDRRDRITPRGL